MDCDYTCVVTRMCSGTTWNDVSIECIILNYFLVSVPITIDGLLGFLVKLIVYFQRSIVVRDTGHDEFSVRLNGRVCRYR